MSAPRKIIHIDMDAFFASVEQRDHPSYRNKPVAVGGTPEQRGAVAAASYEARKYGVYSAMPSRIAKQRCPHLLFVTPRFEVYRAISQQIRAIFHRYTDLVEPLSLDEAYLDVTQNKLDIPSAMAIARERCFPMPRAAIIQPDQSYTFDDYFKLNFAPQDILAYFTVSLQRRSLNLPQYSGIFDRLTDLKARIEESLPRLSLASEMAILVKILEP